MSLVGCRIAIFEDEALLAMWAEDAITAAGGVVTGIAGSVAEAEALLRPVRPSAVVVDLKLRDGDATLLLRRMIREGMPCVITTGYLLDDLSADLRQVPLLPKPYAEAELVDALQRTLLDARSGTGVARPIRSGDGSLT